LLRKYDREFAYDALFCFLVFFVLVSLHINWDGLSSFGNRFFISFTPVFVLGLAVFFRAAAQLIKHGHRGYAFASSATALFILWNLGFVFQWGTHMIPPRGPISWKQMVRNQFLLVPRRGGAELSAYFANRRAMMKDIEQEDVRQLNQQQGGAPPK